MKIYRKNRFKARKNFRVAKRKGTAKNKFFRMTFLFLILIVLTVYFFLFSKFFRVNEIKSAGLDQLQAKQVESILKLEMAGDILSFFPKNSFFLLNTKNIEYSVLKKLPQVKKITIEKKIPNSLSIKVTFKEPVAMGCFENKEKCYFLSEGGVIFQEVEGNEAQNNLPTLLLPERNDLYLGSQALSSIAINNVTTINRTMDNLLVPIETFALNKNKNSLSIKTKEGWTILFMAESDCSPALLKLKSLLEQEITIEKRKALEYIDLRFSKLYYKYHD